MEEARNPTVLQRLRKFYGECRRVLMVTKKPDKMEFQTIVKVSGLGIAIIGFIGFVITIAKQLIAG